MRKPPRVLAVALTTVKAAVLGALLSLLVGVGLHSTAGPSPGTDPVADAYEGVVEEAMSEQHCSLHGFGPDTIPASALVRTPRGSVRVVSFAEGWDVYNGKEPGTLIAVCLNDRPAVRGVSIR